MRYPARLTYQRGTGGYAVRFPDFPEALTYGETKREALRHAVDALQAALNLYFSDGRAIPSPSKATGNQVLVDLPISVSAKALLRNEMVRQQVSVQLLALRMSPGARRRMRKFDFSKDIDINAISQAMNALGRNFEFVLTNVASLSTGV